MKKNELKERYSLTLLYSLIVFCVQILSILVAGVLLYLLSSSGYLAANADGDITELIIFMAATSLCVGLIITLLTRKIPLNPINHLITSMSRLKSGDFGARIKFEGLLRGHKLVQEIEHSFNTMAQELGNTEMLRSDFINNFSHEFKTPIVSIAGFAKLLRRGNLTEEQKDEYLAIIEEESLRLSAMATNVLAMTKVENQTILTDLSRYNLSEQIRSCVLLLEDRWSRKDIELDLEFEEHDIKANEEALKQVWINLIDNAVKFSPNRGEVILRITDMGDTLRVSVTNYGDEIPADKLDKIWAKFYQADESHAGEGNGIGLAVVKAIVELHRGKVSAESQNGCTSFHVELPKD